MYEVNTCRSPSMVKACLIKGKKKKSFFKIKLEYKATLRVRRNYQQQLKNEKFTGKKATFFFCIEQHMQYKSFQSSS